MKSLIAVCALTCILCSCASAPAPRPAAANPAPAVSPAQRAAAPGQDNAPSNLDAAVRSGADYLAEKIPAWAKIAFVSMQSPTDNLSAYIIDTAIMYLVNKDAFTVVERSELSVLQKERNYQLSGEVSDETSVSIGRQLGVQVIISGSLMETGGLYSLRLKALNVETAQILGTRIYRVTPDRTLAALLPPPPEPAKPEPPKTAEPPQTVINGDINIINNNTTTINGDVYVNTPKGFEW
jgi:hypothetical protein